VRDALDLHAALAWRQLLGKAKVANLDLKEEEKEEAYRRNEHMII
jgi:hypothetical protein